MTKKYSLEFENKILKMYDSGLSAKKIGDELGKFTTQIVRVLRRNNRKICTNKGSDHPNWKGGRVLKNGYPAIWNPKHHRTNNVGYVKEHILIMEKEHGRKIFKEEHIHHIDFTRDNNNPNNLWVCSSSNHHIAERSIQKLIKELLEKEIIKFNKDKGIYELKAIGEKLDG